MSSLKAIEKRVFEDLFGMASGYVLDFSDNTFADDPNLVPVIESRLAEAQNCLASAPLATVFLCGSILEGILLGVALQKPKEFNQAANSPKGKENAARIQIHTRQAYGRDLPASTQGSHRRFIRRPEMSCRNRQMELCGQVGRCGRCKTGWDHV
jgi:hypothetical protein